MSAHEISLVERFAARQNPYFIWHNFWGPHGPYFAPREYVDRYREAARALRGKEAEALRWGHRIEEPDVMDLIRPSDVIERIETAVGGNLRGEPTNS